MTGGLGTHFSYEVANLANLIVDTEGRLVSPRNFFAETVLGNSAEKELLTLQAGDFPDSVSNAVDLVEQLHNQLATTLEVGIHRFLVWYRDYFCRLPSFDSFFLKGDYA